MKKFKDLIENKKPINEAIKDPLLTIEKKYGKKLDNLISDIRKTIFKDEWSETEVNHQEAYNVAMKRIDNLRRSLTMQAESFSDFSTEISKDLLNCLFWINFSSLRK